MWTGDFGLIDVPGAETLTEPDRIVGPANFVAYEMMVEPLTANPHRADVYSLAKTLWVLATGQIWPPPGHQPASDELQSIASYRAHARVADLDRLIDRSTRRPEERPTLAGFAAELQAWLDFREVAGERDLYLGDVAARIRARLAPEQARRDLEQERRASAQADAALLAESLQPLRDAVAAAAPGLRGVPTGAARGGLVPPPTLGEPNVAAQWPLGDRVAGPGVVPTVFEMLAIVAALDDGQVQIGGAYLVHREGLLGSSFFRQYGPWRLQPGTAASRQAIEMLVAQMSDDLETALGAFADALG